MTNRQAKEIIQLLNSKTVQFEPGISHEELPKTEALLAIRFHTSLPYYLILQRK